MVKSQINCLVRNNNFIYQTIIGTSKTFKEEKLKERSANQQLQDHNS